MGRKSTTGGVTPLGERIQLYFRLQGERCRPTLDLAPTPPNLRYARRLVADIESRIRAGTFDLAREFPHYRGLARFGADRPAAAASATFAAYVTKWQQSNTKLSPSTLAGYTKLFNRHWLAWFADTRIADIKVSDISVKLGALAVSNKTVNNILACGRVVFDLALADKVITENPAREVEFLDVQGREPDPFTLHEVELLLPALARRWGSDVADYYEFALFSGLRPSEQIELQWPRVDLVNDAVRIEAARVMDTARETKTYSVRELELHSRARAVLERQRARTQAAGRHVFLNPHTGQPWHDERRQRLMLAGVLKALGLRHRAAYQTRHTYATMLLMAGANPAWAADQLGHSVETFLRIYARWIRRQDRGRELAKVEAFTGTDQPATGQSTGQSGGNRRLKAV